MVPGNRKKEPETHFRKEKRRSSSELFTERPGPWRRGDSANGGKSPGQGKSRTRQSESKKSVVPDGGSKGLPATRGSDGTAEGLE